MQLSTLLVAVVSGVSIVTGLVLPEDENVVDYAACMLYGYKKIPTATSIIGWTTLHQGCSRLFPETAPTEERIPKRPTPRQRADPTYVPNLRDYEKTYVSDYPSCMNIALNMEGAGLPDLKWQKITDWVIQHRICSKLFKDTAPPDGQMVKKPTLQQLNDPDYELDWNDLVKEPVERWWDRVGRTIFGMDNAAGQLSQLRAAVPKLQEQARTWRPSMPDMPPVPPFPAGLGRGGRMPVFKPVGLR